MASGLAEALAGLRVSPSESPWGIGAMALGQSAPLLYNPYKSTGTNLAYTLGAGIVTGLLGGLARRQAANETAQLYTLGRQAIKADEATQTEMLKQEPRLGSLLMALEGAKQDRALERSNKLQDIELDIYKAKQLIPVEAEKAGAVKSAERRASPDLLDKLPSEAVKGLAISNSIINEARSVADVLDKANISWSELKSSKMFSGLDDQGIALQIQNLADKLGRARTGAAMSTGEQELYNKLVGGDFTASPRDSAKLLRKLANAEARTSQSIVDFGEALTTSPENVRTFFREQESSDPLTPPPPPVELRAQMEQDAAALKAQGADPTTIKQTLREKYSGLR